MDAAVVERDAFLNWHYESAVYVFFIYAIFFVNAFLPVYGVTVMAASSVLICFVSARLFFPKGLMRYLGIPAILLFAGFIGILRNDPYDVFKDAWYYVNSALILSAGYFMMRRTGRIEPALRAFVIGGFLLALYHLFNVASNPSLLLGGSVDAYRQETGAGYLLTFLSLSIAIFSGRYGLTVFKSAHKIFIIPFVVFVDAASIVLSLSRTMWGAFLIAVFVLSGMLSEKRARTLTIAALALVSIITVHLVTSGSGQSDTTIIGKLSNSVIEVAISDYEFKGDIQSHWRGYESYMAMKTYLDGSVWNLAAGHGFGKLVDIGINMSLGGNEFRFIPVLHNGYMYVLVKTGIIGLALYLWYMYLFYKDGSALAASKDLKDVFAGRMIVALAFVLVFTTLVISGDFNQSALVPVMLLLGQLLCRARMRMLEKGRP